MQALVFDISAWRWLACKAAAAISRQVYASALAGLSLRNVPEPEPPGPDWVVLRTKLAGICGTDLAMISQRTHPAHFLRSFMRLPIGMGHENVAVIERIGDNAGEWRPGQRVCVEPSLSCAVRGIDPPCRECAAGRFVLCENFLEGNLPPGTMLGFNNFTGGTWAPYFLAHRSQLHAVPDAIPDQTAVLVDPLACALHGVLRHTPADDERVLIQGGGIIGLGVMICLRARDCPANVTALVRYPHQAEKMREFGADSVIVAGRADSNATRYDKVAAAIGGRRVAAAYGNQMLIGGFDVVYDCIGTGTSLTDAMKFTRPRGATVALGTSQICVVDTTPLWFSELNLIGVNGRQFEDVKNGPQHTYRLVFDLITSGKLNTAGLLTHTFALADYREALRLLLGRGQSAAIKVAFRF